MLIKLENIGKIYNSNDILTIGIRNINLEFDYNEFVTVEGESGSGKSTLLNVIGANDTYEEGEIYFDGGKTSHYSEAEWQKYRERNIATVFQDFNIIENLTVVENVELALFRIDDVKERRRTAKELIEKVGLEKQINQRGSQLSGGEKQRTVIARALAKNSPVILADEPTGNLDVKSSREIAKLLKDVSKDKLVIVVTHNPEFFKEYATRRVRIYDGKVSEDRLIAKPVPPEEPVVIKEHIPGRKQSVKNTLWLGALNYKSRPKFTAMMTICMAICAITVFVVLSVFGRSLINPLQVTLDDTSVDGKVIISNAGGSIDQNQLDELAYDTNASFYLIDRKLSEFKVTIPRGGGMSSAYTVTVLYDPFKYNLTGGSGVLVLPQALSGDSAAIVRTFTGAGVGIETITTQTTLSQDGIYLYLSNEDLTDNGVKIQGINSTIHIGGDKTTVYTFQTDGEIPSREIRLVNSNYWNIIDKTAVLSVRSNKTYTITDDSADDDTVGGLVVRMNPDDYAAIFTQTVAASQACLYFNNDETARNAIVNLPDGYLGLLSGSTVYAQNAGDTFTNNILYYLALVAICIFFGALISIIFMRSVKIYKNDFAVYRTLGVSRKTSSWSLYAQMALIFLPTLVLLPIVSLIATVVPGSTMAFISAGNYFFIEIMMLLIVELVGFGFNKAINSQSIRKTLKRTGI